MLAPSNKTKRTQLQSQAPRKASIPGIFDWKASPFSSLANISSKSNGSILFLIINRPRIIWIHIKTHLSFIDRSDRVVEYKGQLPVRQIQYTLLRLLYGMILLRPKQGCLFFITLGPHRDGAVSRVSIVEDVHSSSRVYTLIIIIIIK